VKDYLFKSLNHKADNYKIVSKGIALSSGYKPDIVLQNNKDYIIIECETGTSRKGYVGGMVKAAKFLTGDNTGILVYVIKEKSNTNEQQIQAHLTEYFEWMKKLTNLKAIYIISTDKYCPATVPLKLLSKAFYKKTRAIQ
jgi:hypothetical protein